MCFFGMFLLVLCVTSSTFLTTAEGDKQRPLTEYIKNYDTLSYSSIALTRQHDRHRRSVNPSSTPILLNFEAHGKKFRLRLRRHVNLFTDDFQVDNADFDRSKVVEGEVLGHDKSLVHGFIMDGIFEGKIHTGDDEYHVEQAQQYFKEKQPFHSVIFKSKDVDFPHPHGSKCGMSDDIKRWMENAQKSDVKESATNLEHSDNEPVVSRYRRATTVTDKKKKACQLYMQADHLFTNKVGQGNKERALLKMSEHVQAINTIYPGVDFDGDGTSDKIVFVIARMLANGSSEANDPTNPYSIANIGVASLLDLHSEQLRNQDYCLGYLFTYRDFDQGVLGLAWVGSSSEAGGICEKERTYNKVKKILNTGIVTFINYGKPVPQRVSEITFAHEVGHNFGSPHDESAACTPGGSQGNFIMFARATEGSKSNNRKFSQCSINLMGALIKAKGTCTADNCCFEASDAAICGNQVVEAGEECDCGFKGDKSCQDDICCNGKKEGTNDGCTLVTGKTCSPSQGLCCDPKRCEPYMGNNTQLCQNVTDCRNVSFCNGINATCPEAPKKPDLTPCNEGRKLCEKGACTASLCKSKGYSECQCSQEQKMCHLCCDISKDPKNPDCQSTFDMKDIESLKQLPSAPCDNYNGYCDVFLKCRKVDADGPLNRLRKKFFSQEAFMGYLEWITKYWYAVVFIGVGIIIFMAVFIKCCSVHTPSSNPNKKPARQLTLQRRQQQQARTQQERNRRGGHGRGEGYPGPHADAPPPYPGIEMSGPR